MPESEDAGEDRLNTSGANGLSFLDASEALPDAGDSARFTG